MNGAVNGAVVNGANGAVGEGKVTNGGKRHI
jgi:hypothetical protein